MQREFTCIPSFLSKWKQIGLTENDLRELELMLLQNPEIGAVIRGGGGARKVRFAYGHKGKSGGARVIYVDFEVYERIYLLDVYAKSDKVNISKAETNTLKEVIEMLEIDLHEHWRG